MKFFEKIFSAKVNTPKEVKDFSTENEIKNESENKNEVIENNVEQKDEKMKNTAEFREALEMGSLESAEAFLNEVASSPESFPNYDKRWLDHRSRELFQAFYKINDWQGAKRVVEATEDFYSKTGRIARLEELSGLSYDEI